MVAACIGEPEEVTASSEGLSEWMLLFRMLQGHEVWTHHGGWVRAFRPVFGPGVDERFEWASSIDPAELPAARRRREQVSAHLAELLGDDTLLCLPTASGIAPLRNAALATVEILRSQAMSLLCIAGLARLPQVNLPLARLDGCPLGLSLVGPRGADQSLLALASTLAARSRPRS